ncbi:MAG: NADH-quinone oxidoreductase subunit D [Carboxydocellales bacterium]
MIKTQELSINMGPQHPSTHGVFRCVLQLDGETVNSITNHTGYLHRGTEKLAEARTYTQFIPYTDRLDYIGAMLNNAGYVQTVEKLMELEIPERAEYIRIILQELSRISNHMLFVGCYALDMAGYTPWMYTFRDRERILDMLEMVSGSRLTCSFMRIGGVPEDLPEEFFPALQSFLADFPKMIEEYNGLITGNEILQARSNGIGVLTKEMALAYGVTGANLRASGVNYDLRKIAPYGIYDRFDFEVPVLQNGDCFDRYNIRILEMEQSVRIISQAMEQIPEGPIMAKVPKVIKPPVGEAAHFVEAAKGILGFYIVSDGSTKPYRLHIHSPSFVNLGVFPEISKGHNIQDTVLILAGIDIVLGEVDR